MRPGVRILFSTFFFNLNSSLSRGATRRQNATVSDTSLPTPSSRAAPCGVLYSGASSKPGFKQKMFHRFFCKSLETTALVQVVTVQMRRLRTRKGENVVILHPPFVPMPETGCVAKGGKESTQDEWEGQGQLLFGNHFLVPPMVCRAPLGTRDAGGVHCGHSLSVPGSSFPRSTLCTRAGASLPSASVGPSQ